MNNFYQPEPQYQNGLVVGISDSDNSYKDYQLFQCDVTNNNFKRIALQGIQQDTPLNQLFFSKANVDIIQELIRYNVWLNSEKKYVIGRQSDIELQLVMRSIFLQHAKNLPCNLQSQIKELNRLVLLDVLPGILSQVEQYLGYLKRTEYLPVPISHPENVSSAGTRTLRSVTTTF